jgi:hypothetical protein
MRVFLTTPELETEAGKQLLGMTVRIATDGKLDLPEIKELRKWLRENKENGSIPAIGYLHDIMARITADGVIEREELLELHLAVERVIPTTHRAQVIEARKQREAVRRDRLRESRRIEKAKEKEERKRIRAEDYARRMRLRHSFAKVAGVTFPNDDGSKRQDVVRRCNPREWLILRHDAYNAYSMFATQVLRTNGEQLGHAPEYLAERICNEIEEGYKVIGILANTTGGTWDKPTRGANFVAIFMAQDVGNEELQQYANGVLEARPSDWEAE